MIEKNAKYNINLRLNENIFFPRNFELLSAKLKKENNFIINDNSKRRNSTFDRQSIKLNKQKSKIFLISLKSKKQSISSFHRSKSASSLETSRNEKNKGEERERIQLSSKFKRGKTIELGNEVEKTNKSEILKTQEENSFLIKILKPKSSSFRPSNFNFSEEKKNESNLLKNSGNSTNSLFNEFKKINFEKKYFLKNKYINKIEESGNKQLYIKKIYNNNSNLLSFLKYQKLSEKNSIISQNKSKRKLKKFFIHSKQLNNSKESNSLLKKTYK